MSMALVSRLAGSTLRKRSFLALGAFTFTTLGLVSRWPLTANTRPALFRPLLASPFTVSAFLGSAALVPPQPALRWNHTPSELLALTKEAIQRDRESHDRIASLPTQERDFSSVFLALAEAEAAFSTVADPLTFYQSVSPDKELRDASNEADKLVQDYSIELSMRTDVFHAVQDAADYIARSGEKLSGEEQRLIDKMVLEGKRAGLALPVDKRTQLLDLKKQISQVELEFSRNFNEENGHVTVPATGLDGVPSDVIAGYTKRVAEDGSDVYDIPFRTVDMMPIWKYANDEHTRQITTEAYASRLSQNTPLVARALELRGQLASLLGYTNWAAYMTEEKMAKSGTNALSFLEDVEKRLRPLGERELEVLKKMKAEDRAARGLPADDAFYIWDMRYYDRIFRENTLQLDDEAIKTYFRVDRVVPTILRIYQDLLGVRFEEVKGETWHPDVQQFAVWEKDAVDGDGFIGWCYLDLFPRPTKYSHAAVFPIGAGYAQGSSGGPEARRYPVAAMVANLAKPKAGQAALMLHDDVVTFFHEMGHVFHGLLSHTRFMRFHGTQVARDFVEAPSQMLENWCWEPKVLAMMSSHHETGAPLSDELIQRIVKSRYVNVGLDTLRQIFYATFDLRVHMDAEPSQGYTELWNELRTRIGLLRVGEKSPGQSSFGHIMQGYDAGYYGYLYSLVFAADMYKTVFKANPLSAKMGHRYREMILRPGGSRNEMSSLEEFLGRAPNSEAFAESLFGS